MYTRRFTVIFHLLLVTMLLINCVTSASEDETPAESPSPQGAPESLISTESNKMFVATTPRIAARQASSDRRYVAGLDDDDDDENDDEDMQQQQQLVQSRQLSDGTNPLLQIFSAISGALLNHARRTSERLIAADRDEVLKEDNGTVDDNDSVTENANDASNTEKAVEQGRYIQGDPLNGYYDFVITEGSYKFWVVFQLGTAALLIYSTLAAIYYSKVNPLVSDYDYVDYLSRSFHGRAMSEDSADVDDEGTSESGRTYLSSLANNNWVRAAAYGFQFAMDAIDKVPK